MSTSFKQPKNSIIPQLESASLATLFDSVMEGIIIVDHNMIIHYMNPAAQKLADFVDHTKDHNTINRMFPLCDESGACNLDWPIADVVNDHTVFSNIKNFSLKSNTGDIKPVAYSVAPIVLEEDKALGAMITIRDIKEDKELMRLKSEFVSVVSHQLRTPASAAKWNLETLLDNRHGNEINEWQREKLEQSYQSNERMISLINDLLNVSRLDDGQMHIQAEEIELYDVVAQVAKEVGQFAKANNVEIINEMEQNGTLVNADVSKVREVIVNLLTNAIKYTERGHHEVVIKSKSDNGGLVCSVVDGGIGIPKESMQHIFKKFYRADNAVESQTEGSGLGLYIARQIIRLHGGDLWVESEVGKGTTVSFILPIVKP